MAKHPNINSLLRTFRQRGGSRQTTARQLGGKLTHTGTPYWKEHITYEDDDGNPSVADIVRTGTCHFGHAVDDKVRAAGICQIGHEVLCSEEGCMLRCRHCNMVVCRLHSRTYGEVTYCTKHIWVHYWKKFWALEE